MDLSWLQSLILGIVSGVSEFLPVSPEAHLAIVSRVMNIPAADDLLRMILHAASLAALVWFCRWELQQLQEERRIQRSRSRSMKLHSVRQRRILLHQWRGCLIPGLICWFLLRKYDFVDRMPYLVLILLVNGLILFLPSVLRKGNKDGRNMSPIDGFAMSIGNGLGFFPGFSRVNGSLSLGVLFGVDQSYALRLSMLMWIPALTLLTVLDGVSAVTGGLALSVSMLLRYGLAAVAAFLGSSISLRFLKFLSVKVGFSGFCFYSWGLALLSFILYLVV